MDNNERLGCYLARKIFAIGDEPHDKVQRIEFKGGEWPDRETGLGGLCETSLASSIAGFLNELQSAPGKKGD